MSPETDPALVAKELAKLLVAVLYGIFLYRGIFTGENDGILELVTVSICFLHCPWVSSYVDSWRRVPEVQLLRKLPKAKGIRARLTGVP